MEAKETTLDLSLHKLLPTNGQCCHCVRHRADRKLVTFANALKVLAVFTVVGACFTAVTCAVYCVSALKQVRILHTDIVSIQSSINTGPNVGDLPTVSRFTDTKDSYWDTTGDASLSAFDGYDDDDDYYNDDDDYYDDEYASEESDDFTDIDPYDEFYSDKEYSDEGYDDEILDDDNAKIDDDDSDDGVSDGSGDDGNQDIDEGVEDASGFFSDDEEFGRVRRSTDEENKENKRNKKGNGNKGKKRNKKPKKNRNKGTKTKKLKSLLAAQFSANMTEERLMELGIGYDKHKITGDCAYDSGMGGTYCYNKTFTPERRKPLRIFKKESWVNKDKAPVTMNDKKFTVKNDGTHLVYAQILLEGKRHPVSASITRERALAEDHSLTCTNDCINNSDVPTFRCTCSIFGLLNLKKGDNLYMQVHNGINKIIFEESHTYMGVVMLNRD